MSTWKKYKLGDIYDVSSGLSKPREEFGSGNPFVSFRDIFYNYFLPENLTELVNTNIKEIKSCSVRKGDIFLTRTSETLHELGMSSVALKDYPNATFNGFAKRLRKKANCALDIDSIFIGYLLRSKYFRNQIDAVASMTTRASLNTASINAIEIDIPNLNEQIKIGEILKSLDDKIELNLQMNKTLEEMANALYKHWFVDFGPFKDGKFVESELGMIPEGWEVKKLEEVVEFINGYAFKSSELLDFPEGDCYSVFKMGNIKKGGGLKPDGTKSYFKKESAVVLEKYILKKGDLLMSMTDMKDKVTILGHTALMNEDNKFIVNQRVGLLRVKNVRGISYPFLFILTNSYEFLYDLRSKANSGVQVNLSTEAIKNAKFILGTSDYNNAFNDLISPLFEKIFSITKENEYLAQTRDYLLPKLISGEIRVKDVAKAIKEVV
ncbi:MAG: restriction endonuclease subunit S [Bacteroidetes bacterium]|nr:restriction endonuclease subunit S [Bacteroidota bacterium]